MAAAIRGPAMAAVAHTARHLPATAVRIAHQATVGIGLRLMVEVVVDVRTVAEEVDARTAEVVDMRVAAEAAMQVAAAMQVVVTPAATANDRDEDLDVSDKLCH